MFLHIAGITSSSVHFINVLQLPFWAIDPSLICGNITNNVSSRGMFLLAGGGEPKSTIAGQSLRRGTLGMRIEA